MEREDGPPPAEVDFNVDCARILQRRLESNLIKAMLQTGIQAVGGAAAAFYTWIKTDCGCWYFAFSSFSAISALVFCSNLVKYFRIISETKLQRIKSTCQLTSCTAIYCGGVWAVSEGLKDNNNLLWIPSIATSAAAYYYAAKSTIDLAKTVSNTKRILKYSQPMFGPALISGAAYYLIGIKGYKQEWLYCLPLMACCAVGIHLAIKRAACEDKTEPRYQLLTGMELMFSGSLVIASATVLSVHAAMNHFHPFYTTFFTTTIAFGVLDIIASLEALQKCSDMELPVFYCISGMIGVPVILSICVVAKIIANIYTLPMFSVLAGTSIAAIVKWAIDLYGLVRQPSFHRYYQQTFGPTCMVYGILAPAYMGYHMKGRHSWVPALLLPAGMYLTYRGFT